MRKSILLSLVAGLISIFALTSCEDLDELSDLGLRPHILAPALKTEIDIYDFERLLTQTTDYEVPIADIPVLTDVSLPFPGIGPLPEFEPEYLNIFDIAEEISLDAIKATVSFDNIFPVDIMPGTAIVLKDSASGDIIIEHILTQSVAPGGTYSIPIDKENQLISSTISLSMKDLTLASSGTNFVTFDSNLELVVTVAVELIDLDYVILKNDIEYEDEAIHPFDLNIPDASDTSAYSGSLSIFLTNKYPAGFDLKMDLLDENNNLVYEIFGDSSLFVKPADVDDQGNVIRPVVAEKIDFIDVEDISDLNAVKNMRVSVTLKTPSSPDRLVLTEITTIDMLVTADIKVDPSKTQ